MNRRQFLSQASVAVAWATTGCSLWPAKERDRSFQISLAEWSYHKALFGKKMTHMDFPIVARRTHDLDGIELVNQFFKDQVKDTGYLKEFKDRADSEGVRCLLIMCGCGQAQAGRRKPSQVGRGRQVPGLSFDPGQR